PSPTRRSSDLDLSGQHIEGDVADRDGAPRRLTDGVAVLALVLAADDAVGVLAEDLPQVADGELRLGRAVELCFVRRGTHGERVTSGGRPPHARRAEDGASLSGRFRRERARRGR